MQNDFRVCGIDINSPIQYDTFVKWIYQDHVIYLNYSFKSVAIATSLIYLDDIEFIDNLGSSMLNSGKLFFLWFVIFFYQPYIGMMNNAPNMTNINVGGGYSILNNNSSSGGYPNINYPAFN